MNLSTTADPPVDAATGSQFLPCFLMDRKEAGEGSKRGLIRVCLISL